MARGWHPWRAAKERRRVRWDYAVLAAVATGHDTGFALWKLFGSSGWVYIALARNEVAGRIERWWDHSDPPRVHYRVSRAGLGILSRNTTSTDAEEATPC